VKPVEQRRLWRPDDHPDGPQRGDCLRACVASILEVEYEDVPDFNGMSQPLNDWLKSVAPGFAAPYRYLTSLGHEETLDDWKSWPTSHYEEGYWIATVYSHRIPDYMEYGCGCVARVPGGDPECKWCHGDPGSRAMGIVWGLHAVVFQHGRLAWDPHPERDKGFGPFRGVTRFVLADPAPAFAACALRSDPAEEAADAA
jgi:hypothetical protein